MSKTMALIALGLFLLAVVTLLRAFSKTKRVPPPVSSKEAVKRLKDIKPKPAPTVEGLQGLWKYDEPDNYSLSAESMLQSNGEGIEKMSTQKPEPVLPPPDVPGWPPIARGTRVKTTQPNFSKREEWDDAAWLNRKWGVCGTVYQHHDSHGLCYHVLHDDGSDGYYDPSELEVLPSVH